MKWVEEVRKRMGSEKPPVSGGKSDREFVGFDEIVFLPAQVYKRPVDYFREDISTKTTIGKYSKHPLILNTPILIAAMSFGALSREAKIALARASSIVGTATNTGEGGMLPEERKFAKLLIVQYSTGRFGVDENYLKSGDAVEIKFGQGAKPGQGGLLPKEKVTKEIMKIRKIKKLEDIHSPPAHPDIMNWKDLKKKIRYLRDVTNKKPIIVKMAAGNIKKDLPLILKAKPDAVAIDGYAGGTGAAPEVMMNEFGIPTIASIPVARNIIEKNDSKVQLLVGGGIYKGGDIGKAIALGADAVFMGFPFLICMGCIYCKSCYKGLCPKGITTQNPKLRKRFKMEKNIKNIVNYITSCTEEVKMIAAACGYKDVHHLKPSDLRATNPFVSALTGIKIIGE